MHCMEKVRLLRVTTVPISLATLLKGQPEFFARHNFDVLTVSSDGPEVKQLLQLGVKHQVIPMTRKITPIQDVIALIKLIQLIRTFRPNIVHTHTPKAGLLGMMAAWICRVPVRMHTIAGLPWMESTGSKRWLLKKVEVLTYWCATRVYPNSNQLKKFLMNELKFKGVKTHVIGRGSSNGIDVRYFSRQAISDESVTAIRQPFGIPNDDFVYCFVGRIVRDKGIAELVKAFQSLKQDKVWLMLVGHQETELDPLSIETLDIIKDNKRIIETGFQSDVRPWLAASDAFVFPSYREGFPNVVMQAACMELPCVVSNINGCNEIIQQGQSGLIIPVKNTESLKQAMEQIALDKQRAHDMGKVGRAYVSAHFDQTVVWGELLKECNRHFEPEGLDVGRGEKSP
jgi:glycosyltransferase involved in cell wall biosynthesis